MTTDQMNSTRHALVAVCHQMRALRHRMAAQAGLNVSEYDLLAALHHAQRPMSVKELSQSLFLCSQAITKITKSLCRHGYLLTYKSATDRRITYVSPTELAHKLTIQEAALQQQWLASNLHEHLSADAAQHFLQGLTASCDCLVTNDAYAATASESARSQMA